MHGMGGFFAAIVVGCRDEASQSVLREAVSQYGTVDVPRAPGRRGFRAVRLESDTGESRSAVDRHPETQSHARTDSTEAPVCRADHAPGAQHLSDSAG